VKKSIKNVKKR